MEIFKIHHLTYSYPGQTREALTDISLNIREGKFVLLTGPSGGGKTTLARILGGFIPDFYGGTIQGDVLFEDQSICDRDRREIRKSIGMVFQDPEKQIIMGEVERDLALGLENLGLDPALMNRRVIETLNYMGLTALRHRATAQLSSGEKQKVAIGSILSMLPHILILDEPLSQLDPIATQEILEIVGRLNRDHGFTIIMIEQRVEECLTLASRVIMLEEGKVIIDESPRNFVQKAFAKHKNILPEIPQLFCRLNSEEIPLNVAEARPHILSRGLKNNSSPFFPEEKKKSSPLIEVKNLSFAYPASSAPIIENLQCAFGADEFTVILGENGAGKSTLLKLLAGVVRPTWGNIRFAGEDYLRLNTQTRAQKMGYLSQNPDDYLFHETVREELLFTLKNLKMDLDENAVLDLLRELDIERYRDSYPRDLSAGERQRVALASVLIAQPQVVFLDEPTRGLDRELKLTLGEFLKNFQRRRKATIVLISQDVEFAANYAERVILFSQGRIVVDGVPQTVLNGNLFYSTQINKMFRGIVDGVINLQQAQEALLKL